MALGDYYVGLAAERLRRCYELAPPRVQRHLAAEIDFVRERISPEDRVLELGCGYGRVLCQLVERARVVVGIDTVLASLELARRNLSGAGSVHLLQMSAVRLAFGDRSFDLVACIQNGVSAFGVDRRELIQESVRVTRSGGLLLFSSYSPRFWSDRLRWFEIQAEHGLIGEIDREATGDGTIVCKDGFRATTVDVDEFRSLVAGLPVEARITEVDGSSVFCELEVG